MVDYKFLTPQQLVKEHNTLVDRLKAWPETAHHQHVTRFRDKQVAVARCVAMATIIKQKETWDVAPPKKTEAKAPAPAKEKAPKPERTEPTIKELTKEYNDLLAAAAAKGLTVKGAKHHTSDFGDRNGAVKQVNLLKEKIAEAEAEAKKPKKAA